MNYRNAQDIFPEQLLKQIQRYVSGETIYIPASEQKKKAWGESSGYRAYLAKRNQAIRDEFAGGCDIDSLADKYCLSVDSVKHIVYTKKDPDMPPLIVHYVEDDFELNDGNTRFQAYTNFGVKEVNVIVWITEEAEYQDFLKLYGKYVQGAPVIRR